MISNGIMANSSKKRKASDFDSDLNDRSTTSKARSKTKKGKHTKAVDEIPFRPECPYTPPAKATKDDVFVQKEEIAPGFEFEFSIRPGLRWKNMRTYRNVKLQDHTFSVGTIIYINKQNPPPPSPPPDATDEEILRYDRSNFWVGRIADTRAESDKAVFLRVYWLYWPEELPMGRQPYHGDRELVLSNAMDIVDAQTISGAADLTYWDEKDNNNLYRDRFWRQTFDISRLGKDRKGGLSELRRHCRCHQPHNPDKTMFQCKRSSCMIWNHEECLIEDVSRRTWAIYDREGTLDRVKVNNTKVEELEGESSLSHRLLTPVRSLGKIVHDKISPAVNTVVEQSIPHTTTNEDTNGSSTLKKGKPPKKPTRANTPANPPWDGKIKVHVINTDDKDDESPTLARVEEIAGKRSKSEARSWLVHVNCLVCDQAM